MDKRTKQDKKIDRVKDRGDLRKSTLKTVVDDNNKDPIAFADRGDSVIQKPNKLKITELDSKGGNKRSNIKNVSNATGGKEKNIEIVVQKQVVSNLDIIKLIRERYTVKQDSNVDKEVTKDIHKEGGRNDVTVTKNGRPQVKSDRTVNRSKKLLPEPQPRRNPEPFKARPKETIVDITTKRPDNEMSNKKPDRELSNKKLDKESTNKHPDRDSSYRKIDKELTGRKPDRELSNKKLDKGLIEKKPDRESSNRKLDRESTNKKPVRELSNKKLDKESTIRKPIIKTVTSKNTSKSFKAVTFGNFRESKSQPKPLQINIPNAMTSKIIITKKSTDAVASKPKTRVQRERSDIRRKIFRKRIRKSGHASPDSYKFRENKSPPTEVAKWAPCCVNRHTKPYYEAWVNTTLAAISNSSKKDKLFMEKRSIIQSFQRALEERAESPELIYEKLKDEKYTGRIRVISRHR